MEEYDINSTTLRNLKEYPELVINGKKYPFAKSMKLKKGNYTVNIIFDESINSC